LVQSCRFVIANGVRCTTTHRIITIYFHHPEEEFNSVLLKLCDVHYRENFGDIELEEKQWKYDIEKATTELKIAKKLARVNDSFIGPERSMEVDDLWTSWKNRRKFCSRVYCRKRIMYDMTVYSAVVWNSRGAIIRTFNYCSNDCFQKTKNSCGEHDPRSILQKTLIDQN